MSLLPKTSNEWSLWQSSTSSNGNYAIKLTEKGSFMCVRTFKAFFTVIFAGKGAIFAFFDGRYKHMIKGHTFIYPIKCVLFK